MAGPLAHRYPEPGEARSDRSEMGDFHRPPRHTPCRDFYHSLWIIAAQCFISPTRSIAIALYCRFNATR